MDRSGRKKDYRASGPVSSLAPPLSPPPTPTAASPGPGPRGGYREKGLSGSAATPPTPKGKVLYEEEWASERRFKDRLNIIMGPVIMFMALVLIGIGIFVGMFSGSDMDSVMFMVMMVAISIFLLIMGLTMMTTTLKRMPFRIYEGGFSLPDVPLMQGMRRQESFVPWARLERAYIKSEAFMTVNIRKIVLVHDGGKELELSYDKMDDPMEVMLALSEHVADRMSDEFEEFIGPGDKRRRVTKPIPEERQKASVWRPVMPLFMAVFILVLVGAVLGPTIFSGKILGTLVLGATLGPVAILMFYMSIHLHKSQVEKDIIKYNSKVGPGGVMLENRGLGMLVRRMRPVIPFQEIRTFRTKLDPLFFSQEASFLLSNDEEYWFRYENLEAARRYSGFEDRDLYLVNRSPVPVSEPVAKWNPLGILLMFLLLAVALPVSALGLGEVVMVGMESLQFICLVVVFAVLLPVLMLSMWLVQRRSSLGEGFWADAGGIYVPRAPEKFHFVPLKDIIRITKGKDLLGPYVVVQTTRGNIKLPYSVTEKMEASGYRIDEAGGFTAPSPEASPPKPLPEKPEGTGAVPVGPEAASSGPPAPDAQAESSSQGRTEPSEAKMHTGRGALLYQQPDDHLEGVKGKMKRLSLMVALGGVGLLALAILLQMFVISSDLICSWYLLLIFYIMGPGLILIGPYVFRLASGLQPIRIYEHGISFPDNSREDGEVFVPYGQMTGVGEAQQPLYGEVYRVNLRAQGIFKNMYKDMPGVGKFMEMIRKRAGDPAYDDPDFDIMSEGTMKRMEMAFYLIAFVVGFLSAGMAIFLMELASEPVNVVAGVLFFGSPVTMLFLIYTMYFIAFRQKKMHTRSKPNLKRFGATVVVLLILFGAGYYMYASPVQSTSIYRDDPPAPGVYTNGTHTGLDVNLTENIYVARDRSLVIRDSTIRFDMSENKQYSVYVEEGGYLELDNVTLTSTLPDNGYAFEIHGAARIVGSELTHLYHPDYQNGDGGLEIYSSDVLIHDNVIADNRANGMMVVGASPSILGNTFRNCEDDAIELNRAPAIIMDNHFEDNEWGILVQDGSDAIIRNNTFLNNPHAIFVDGSEPTIFDNRFQGSEEFAIAHSTNCEPEIGDNTYAANGQNIKEDEGMAGCFSTCALVMVLIAIVASAVVAFVIRSRGGKGGERPAPAPPPSAGTPPGMVPGSPPSGDRTGVQSIPSAGGPAPGPPSAGKTSPPSPMARERIDDLLRDMERFKRELETARAEGWQVDEATRYLKMAADNIRNNDPRTAEQNMELAKRALRRGRA